MRDAISVGSGIEELPYVLHFVSNRFHLHVYARTNTVNRRPELQLDNALIGKASKGRVRSLLTNRKSR